MAPGGSLAPADGLHHTFYTTPMTSLSQIPCALQSNITFHNKRKMMSGSRQFKVRNWKVKMWTIKNSFGNLVKYCPSDVSQDVFKAISRYGINLEENITRDKHTTSAQKPSNFYKKSFNSVVLCFQNNLKSSIICSTLQTTTSFLQNLTPAIL